MGLLQGWVKGSVTDRKAGRTLLVRLRERHWRVSRIWADGGYTGRLVDFARGVLLEIT